MFIVRKGFISPQTTIDQMQAKYQHRNTGYAGFKHGALNVQKSAKRSDFFHMCMLRGFFLIEHNMKFFSILAIIIGSYFGVFLTNANFLNFLH